MKLLRNLILAIGLLCLPITATAQIPNSINIRTTIGTDSTKFTFSWPLVSGYSTYDLITFSNPRLFDFEQFRVVTGNSWTITVPNNMLNDSIKVYGSVRVSMSPRYGSITYRPVVTTPPAPPPPAPTVPLYFRLVSKTLLTDTTRIVVSVELRRKSDSLVVSGKRVRWSLVSNVGGFGGMNSPTDSSITTSVGIAQAAWRTVSNVESQIKVDADSTATLIISKTDVVVTPPPPPPAPPPPAPPAPPTPIDTTNFFMGAELPRIRLNINVPITTGRTIIVNAGDNLQAALNQAVGGDKLLLQAGASFIGNFTLPARADTGIVLIRTNIADSLLPAFGVRIHPTDAVNLAKITTGNSSHALSTGTNASGYYVMGIEINTLPSVTSMGALITLGDLDSNPNNDSKNIVFDRMYIHGTSTMGMQRCISLHSKYTAIINSWLGECHGKGFDSQAIVSWNGEGPYLIENNYLEGAGETIMFGGANPAVVGRIPSDIVVRYNHLNIPRSWKGPWTIKNNFELKFARRVLLENNIFEGSQVDGQTGFSILFKSSGDTPGIGTTDVVFRDNIVRNSGAGFNIADLQGAAQIHTERIVVYNNLIENIGPPEFPGSTQIFQLLSGTNKVVIDGNLVLAGPQTNNNSLIALGDTYNSITNLVIRNNVAILGRYGIKGSGQASGLTSLDAYSPSYTFENNTFLLPSSNVYNCGTRLNCTNPTWVSDLLTTSHAQRIMSQINSWKSFVERR